MPASPPAATCAPTTTAVPVLGADPDAVPDPADGPVGRLLAATGRSPMRAPHLHFMVSAPGFRTLITHIFVAGESLGGDSVFGVRDSLVKPFVRSDGRRRPTVAAVEGSWTQVRFDIVLAAAAG